MLFLIEGIVKIPLRNYRVKSYIVDLPLNSMTSALKSLEFNLR